MSSHCQKTVTLGFYENFYNPLKLSDNVPQKAGKENMFFKYSIRS